MKRSPMKRGKPVKKINGKRRQSEFARAYGSRERVAFVKALPCCNCGRTPSENAHTQNGGTSRKADADTIAPLCRVCHGDLHQFGAKTFQRVMDVDLATEAATCEAAWTAHQKETEHV